MKTPKLVEILWGDAWGSTGWRDFSKGECKPEMITSIGYLLHENKEGYLLASGIAHDNINSFLQVNFKPRGMVKHIKVLRK